MASREELELIGRELADCRIKADLTQATVGTALGVARRTVAQWERGARSMTMADLCRMADLYDVRPSEIIRRALDAWIPPTLRLVDVSGGPNYESQARRSR